MEIKDKDRLAHINQPASKVRLDSALLQREVQEDLLGKLILRWPTDQNSDALSRLALPLWAAYGPARLDSVEESSGGQFLLTLEDGNTRLRLALPFDDQTPALVAEDNRGPSALKARGEAVAQSEQRERQERLAAGKPQTRLARFVRLPAQGIDSLALGMTDMGGPVG